MTWKGIDFQGIMTLDQALIDELRNYLLEKESQFGKTLALAVGGIPQVTAPIKSLPGSIVSGSLLEVTEQFAKNVRSISKNKTLDFAKNACKNASNQINASLWDYVEILEGCITELFQQLKYVSFEEWNPELVGVVDTVNEILIQKIREMYRVIDLLKLSLNEYCEACQRMKGISGFKRFLGKISFNRLIDPSILRALKKCEKELTYEKETFITRYNSFLVIREQVEEALKKFSEYVLLNKLEDNVQANFKRIYKLLKIWKLNVKADALPSREPIRAMRSAFSIEKATEIFKDYYAFLKQTLFERSKMLKMGSKDLYEEEANKKSVLEAVNGYRSEIHTLGATIEQYRDFFLESHPDPYVRSRWGFPEWVVGPEPVQSEDLQHLVFKIEWLDKLYADICRTIHNGPLKGESNQLSKQYREILSILHEMGQPLISRAVMRSRSERILNILQEMNELGSFNPEVIDYSSRIFSKAMRVDWQYHVLFEFSSFHSLYEIHQGLIGKLDSHSHINRMNKFKAIIHKLREWVKNREALQHLHEIEMEMSDIKLYLQEFLAQVQRTVDHSVKGPESVRKVTLILSSELLEYRYLFGSFFYFLLQNETEGKSIRNQFLFVDQYFEAVENHIHELLF
jgi:hypothetical protein